MTAQQLVVVLQRKVSLPSCHDDMATATTGNITRHDNNTTTETGGITAKDNSMTATMEDITCHDAKT